MTQPKQGVMKSVPFSTILVDLGLNARTEYDDIDELADDIRARGLLENFIVSPLPKEQKNGHDYVLNAGFRRAMALKKLRYGDREVPVLVKDFEGDGAQAALTNFAENAQRENLHAADMAARFHDFEEGVYPTPPGTEPTPIERGHIAKQANKSYQIVGNLIRAHKNLPSEIKRGWRKARDPEIPLRLIFEWAGMKKAVVVWTISATKDGNEVVRKAYSKAEADEIVTKLEKQGHERVKNDGGKERELPDEEAMLKGYESWKQAVEALKGDDGKPKRKKKDEDAPPTKKLVTEELLRLAEKEDESKGKEAEFLRGKLVALEWVLGKRKSLR